MAGLETSGPDLLSGTSDGRNLAKSTSNILFYYMSTFGIRMSRNNKEVFVKHEKAPTAPPIRRGNDYLVYAHVLENPRYWAFLANFRWPKLSKGTSSGQDLSYKPIHI